MMLFSKTTLWAHNRSVSTPQASSAFAPIETLNTPNSITLTDIFQLSLVSLGWGLTFPVMKLGLLTYPAVTFRGLSLIAGILMMGAYLVLKGQSLRISRNDAIKLAGISQINLTAWQLGLLYGILLLGAGRAAILGYTMPVWAFVASIAVYGAAVTWRGVTGVALALSAVAALTLNDCSAFLQSPSGLLVTVVAAMCWGLGTAMIRNTPLSISNESMAFWSLVSTLPAYVILAIWLERDLWRMPNLIETLTMLYGGVVSFSFCYVVWYRVSRKLPPVVSSLSIMLVPAIGVLSSGWILAEPITALDILALVLILLAMAVVLLPARYFSLKRMDNRKT